MRFSLIDRITDLQPGKSIAAIKTLSLAEEYLQDHFPGFPIMPGVLVVESMVQSSAWLLRASENFEHSTVLLKQAKAVKFNRFVAPGETIEVRSEVVKQEPGLWTFKAATTVDGVSAVSARLVLEAYNLAEAGGGSAAADEELQKHSRALFEVLSVSLTR